MPKAKQSIQLDDEVKIIKKRKPIKPRKSKHIVTEAMIAEAAYYKAEQRSFEPGHEEHDWLEAESELSTV